MTAAAAVNADFHADEDGDCAADDDAADAPNVADVADTANAADADRTDRTMNK